MVSVLLLGDSIRMYTENKVREFLGEEYEMYSPEDNCKFSTLTLNSLQAWLKDVPLPQIIHWNNGLWDTARVYEEDGCFTSPELYEMNLRRILRELKKTGAKIIFATTTPTDPKKAEKREGMSVHYIQDIIEYNKIALKVMAENGIPVNDLFAVVDGKQDSFIRQDDLIHPTEEGVEALAKQIVEKIRNITKI